MPPIGLLLGGIDFSKLEFVLKPDDPVTAAVEKVSIQYGAFVNTIIQFLIIGWVVFLMVKTINRMRKPPEGPPADVVLLSEIRDLLKSRS
jgi:large conductance mechanosensitive channel